MSKIISLLLTMSILTACKSESPEKLTDEMPFESMEPVSYESLESLSYNFPEYFPSVKHSLFEIHSDRKIFAHDLYKWPYIVVINDKDQYLKEIKVNSSSTDLIKLPDIDFNTQTVIAGEMWSYIWPEIKVGTVEDQLYMYLRKDPPLTVGPTGVTLFFFSAVVPKIDSSNVTFRHISFN